MRLFQGVKHEEMGELGQLLGMFGSVVQLDGAVQAMVCLALPL